MTKLAPLNEIHNDTPADATYVDANYTAIRSHVNDELINRDGSVAMDAQLHLFGDPTGPNDAATKSYVDAILPVGVMLPFCGEVAPDGSWALCNGAGLSPTLYPKLFRVIEYRYGGSGNTFNLPNMSMRFPIGRDYATTPRADFNATGKTGGTLAASLLQHNHAMPHTHTINHDHPSASTGVASAWHHTHDIDHNHASFLTSATAGVNGGQHTHELATSVRQTSTPGTSSSFMQAGTAGTTDSVTNNPNIDENLSQHIHLIDVPLSTGLVSGSDGVDHTHGINLPVTTGLVSGAVSTTNTSNFGTASAEQIPPFVVVAYIVRID